MINPITNTYHWMTLCDLSLVQDSSKTINLFNTTQYTWDEVTQSKIDRAGRVDVHNNIHRLTDFDLTNVELIVLVGPTMDDEMYDWLKLYYPHLTIIGPSLSWGGSDNDYCWNLKQQGLDEGRLICREE